MIFFSFYLLPLSSILHLCTSSHLSCVNLLFPHTHVSHHGSFPHVIAPNITVRGLHEWMNEWMNVWTNSPNETLSLDAPLRESLSPSPTLPLGSRTQTKESQEKLDKDEGDQAGSIPCYEIHATGLRRCSEPLPYNLPQPQAEPPMKMFTHLMVSSEQRSLSCCVFLQILS